MARVPRRALLLAAPALKARGAHAQRDWPSRPITWLVPFAAGGIADAASRVVARRMSASFGRPIVVENRPGAGGTIGAEAVARAAPDGHTLLYGGQGPMAAAPALFPDLRYDPRRDFAPVHGLAGAPTIVVTHPGRRWRTLAELVAAARERPWAVSYGSPGVGTGGHLAAELLQQVAGVRMTHVPYANGAQALGDVIGGRLDAAWDYLQTSIPHLREGRLRALAVADARRVALARDVPTVAEAGVPGVEMVSWAGLFVPARTPEAVVARLAGATREALDDPKVQEFFEGTATALWPEVGPERLRAFLDAEIPRVAALIARAGARAG
jgi:tripartite-type tricarboxylate transporter receptor subunit TctC